MRQINLWGINKWTNNYVKKYSNMERKKRVDQMKFIFGGYKFKVNGHIPVVENKSPYDNDWLYWARRSCKRYTGSLLKAAAKQKYHCFHCNNPFRAEDIIELHYKDGNNNNNRMTNLIALHRYCHQYQTMYKIIQARKVSS